MVAAPLLDSSSGCACTAISRNGLDGGTTGSFVAAGKRIPLGTIMRSVRSRRSAYPAGLPGGCTRGRISPKERRQNIVQDNALDPRRHSRIVAGSEDAAASGLARPELVRGDVLVRPC